MNQNYQKSKANFDVCVIGGGINGAGIARDIAGRGVSTLLLEKGDFGNATSSASSKMIHGGLRYLEHYEFGLVRSALKERNVLLKIAPHLVSPMRFVLPHEPYLRPAWMIRLGLFFYDFLARRHKRLKRSGGFSLKKENPLHDKYRRAFSYYDCMADDARLVIANVMDAKKQGAHVRPYHECLSIERKGGLWLLHIRDSLRDTEYCVTAKMVVNASGPWVRSVLDQNNLAGEKTLHVRMVKGSHIIVPKLYEGDHGYLLQQPDGRVIFLWPYQGKYTLVGTTEEAHASDPKAARISDTEIDYLCAAVNRSFKNPVSPHDILWSYSGVRPLLEDGEENASAVTRDYKFELNEEGAPLLSIFGGKLTTYRVLSEKAGNKIMSALGIDDPKGRWTHKSPLPGGAFLHKDMASFIAQQKKRYPWVPQEMLHRYAHAYGTNMDQILQHGDTLVGLGKHYGDGVYEMEILYMIKQEVANTLEDVLWRRSKLGLHISQETHDALAGDFPRLWGEVRV